MIDPKDRLLDLGLQQLLGEEAEAKDLGPQVLAAWEAGERRPAPRLRKRGPDSAATHDPAASSQPVPRQPRTEAARTTRTPLGLPQRVWIPAAAAAAALLAWGATRWSAEAPGSPSQDLPLAGANDPAPGTTPGQAAQPWISPAGTTFQLGEGALAVIEGDSALRQPSPASLDFASGELSLRGGEEPVELTLAEGARLILDPGGSLHLRLRLDRPPYPVRFGPGPLATWWQGERPAAHRLLEWEQLEGGAALRTGRANNGPDSEEKLEVLAAGERATFFAGPNGWSRASASDLLIAEDLLRLSKDDLLPIGQLERWQQAGAEGPLAWLREQPALWIEAEPILAKFLQPGGLPGYGQSALIDLLCIDSSPLAFSVLREAWMGIPERYSPDALVALAQRGAPEFQRECDVFLDYWDGDASGTNPLAVALFHALRGRGNGALLLAQAAAKPATGEGGLRASAAAAGLARLGDRLPWEDHRAQRARAIEASLERSGPSAAAESLAVLAYLHAMATGEPLPESPAKVSASFLEFELDRFLQGNPLLELDAAGVTQQLAWLLAR